MTLGKMTKGQTAGTYKGEAFANLVKKRGYEHSPRHSNQEAERWERQRVCWLLEQPRGLATYSSDDREADHGAQWVVGYEPAAGGDGPQHPRQEAWNTREHPWENVVLSRAPYLPHRGMRKRTQIKAFLPNGCWPLWDLSYALWSPWKPSDSSARAAVRMTTIQFSLLKRGTE